MIIPAILETDFEEVKRKVDLIDDITGTVHVDIDDGELVSGKTFLEVEKLGDLDSEVQIELHLMVKDPLKYLMPLGCVTKIIAHIESENIEPFINKAKKMNMMVGISINPDTDSNTLNEYAEKVDFIQFMTVVPGAQGRDFDAEVLKKIVLFKSEHPHTKVQVDGGVGFENIQKVIDAGVDDIVVGSTIFSSEDPVETLEELQGEVEKQ